MANKHFGQLIKGLVSDRNLSITRLSEITGRTRQQIHGDFHRVIIKDDVLAIYAHALKIDKEAIYKMAAGGSIEENNFGENVLNEIKRMIEEELKEKNDQIRSLQESLKDAQALIKMAMGKPEDVMQSLTSPIMRSLYPELDKTRILLLYPELGEVV
jgi:hypothetical protein